MTRDAADYRADSRTGDCSGDNPGARAVRVLAGLGDAKAGARADQRARSGAVNGAPAQLALLCASAQEQSDGGNRRQQK